MTEWLGRQQSDYNTLVDTSTKLIEEMRQYTKARSNKRIYHYIPAKNVETTLKLKINYFLCFSSLCLTLLFLLIQVGSSTSMHRNIHYSA